MSTRGDLKFMQHRRDLKKKRHNVINPSSINDGIKTRSLEIPSSMKNISISVESPQNEKNEIEYPNHMKPDTLEKKYYYNLFCNNFVKEQSKSCKYLFPRYWMPNFVKDATDSSARTLKVYNNLK